MTDSAAASAVTEQTAWTFPSVGRWGLSVLPAGWTFVQGFGVRQLVSDARQVAASVGLAEDKLLDGMTLPGYIAAQATLISGQIVNARLAGPQPSAFPGAEEAFLFMVRHQPEGLAEMLHVQTYVRHGVWIGIITLTTAEAVLREVRPHYEGFLKGLCILPESAPQG